MVKISSKANDKIATNLLKGSVIFVMKNIAKQVVILDNIPSAYIHQAIIILKSYPPNEHDKIIEEAERIVSGYFNNNILNSKQAKTKKDKGLIIALSIVASFVILGIISFILK